MSTFPEEKINTVQLFSTMAERGVDMSEALLAQAAAPFDYKKLPLWGIEKAAKLAKTTSATIRRLEKAGELPQAKRHDINRRVYSLQDVNRIRARTGSLFKRPPGSLPLRCVVANLKGGTGKTTTAVHLAQYAALQGLNVLLVDLDPQASTTNAFGLLPDIHVATQGTLAEPLVVEKLDEARQLARNTIKQTYWHQLDLIPSQLNMVSVDGELTNKDGRDRIYRLRDILEDLEQDYDLVVVDVPPALGLLSVSAMVAADYLLVPIVPNMPDIASSIQYFTILSDVAEHMTLTDMNIMIARHEPSRHSDAAAALIRSIYGINVINAQMLATRELSKSSHDLLSVYEIDKPTGSRDTYKRALSSMNAVNGEILTRFQGIWEQQTESVQKKTNQGTTEIAANG